MKIETIPKSALKSKLQHDLWVVTRFDDKAKQSDFTFAAATSAIIADLNNWVDAYKANEPSI